MACRPELGGVVREGYLKYHQLLVIHTPQLSVTERVGRHRGWSDGERNGHFCARYFMRPYFSLLVLFLRGFDIKNDVRLLFSSSIVSRPPDFLTGTSLAFGYSVSFGC